jgi:general secretion pathway protein G
MKKSFTLIELVFVIVILGILSAVAMPKFFGILGDSKIAKVQTVVATVRGSISTKYGKNVMAGDDTCPKLEKTPDDTTTVFENILTYPIKKNGAHIRWDGNGTDYNVTVDGGATYIKFKYDTSQGSGCKFSCVSHCDLIGE